MYWNRLLLAVITTASSVTDFKIMLDEHENISTETGIFTKSPKVIQMPRLLKLSFCKDDRSIHAWSNKNKTKFCVGREKSWLTAAS